MNNSSSGLRILMLTPQLPYPPMQGTSLRNFHVLQGLALDHKVHLLSFSDATSHSGITGPGPLDELCEKVTEIPTPRRTRRQRLLRFFFDARPDMAHRLRSAPFKVQLQSVLAVDTFDLVQIEGLELAYAIPLVRHVSPESKIVFDDHNAEAELQYRAFLTDIRQPRRWPAAFYSFVQARRLRRYERNVCMMSDAVSVVSQEDRKHLQHLEPALEPFVVPNCIDVRQYHSLREDPDCSFDVVFVGKMDYRPNVDAALWFGQQIWPKILNSLPKATCAIVGQKPHARLEALQGLAGLTITGRVARVQPFLAGARVYVMPFRMGSGTRLKLIEAMAAGKAVVSTTLGAEGFPVADGKHLLLADDPDTFAGAVIRLLHREEERRSLAVHGRVLAEQYDWRRVIPLFNALYAGLIAYDEDKPKQSL